MCSCSGRDELAGVGELDAGCLQSAEDAHAMFLRDERQEADRIHDHVDLDAEAAEVQGGQHDADLQGVSTKEDSANHLGSCRHALHHADRVADRIPDSAVGVVDGVRSLVEDVGEQSREDRGVEEGLGAADGSVLCPDDLVTSREHPRQARVTQQAPQGELRVRLQDLLLADAHPALDQLLGEEGLVGDDTRFFHVGIVTMGTAGDMRVAHGQAVLASHEGHDVEAAPRCLERSFDGQSAIGTKGAGVVDTQPEVPAGFDVDGSLDQELFWDDGKGGGHSNLRGERACGVASVITLFLVKIRLRLKLVTRREIR